MLWLRSPLRTSSVPKLMLKPRAPHLLAVTAAPAEVVQTTLAAVRLKVVQAARQAVHLAAPPNPQAARKAQNQTQTLQNAKINVVKRRVANPRNLERAERAEREDLRDRRATPR